ncbi:uncharacterized protein LOC107795557 [Nicotiana tabacum]|uniref:Uncharacterized protein LOC107795557 n=1 Tax=Nicotiana tabacum TaxID=4097 RepID=A0AC58T472_TOBAC
MEGGYRMLQQELSQNKEKTHNGPIHNTTIQRVEEELNKLKSLEVFVAPTTVSNGLKGLEKLYKCIDDLLNLPQTLHALSQSLHAKWVEDLLDKSMRLLDLCGTTRELVSQCKENVRDLQSSLRRRKGDSTTDDNVTRFYSFSKKIKRNAKRLVLTLKQMDQDTTVSVLLDADQDTIAVIRALKEANAECISTFQMLLSFLCVPLLKPKESKWSLLSRLVNKERIASLVLAEKMSLETRLESFETYLVSFEDGLENQVATIVISWHSEVWGKEDKMLIGILWNKEAVAIVPKGHEEMIATDKERDIHDGQSHLLSNE